MEIVIVLIVLLSLIGVGAFVWKASVRQDEQSTQLVAATEKTAEAAEQALRTSKELLARIAYKQSTLKHLLTEHFGAEVVKTPFAHNIAATPEFWSIRKFVQGIQEAGYTVDKLVRDIEEYPQHVCIAVEGVNGTKFVFKIEDKFVTADRIEDKETFKIWSEEEGILDQHLWLGCKEYRPMQVIVDHTCAENCSLEDLTVFRDAAIAAKVTLTTALPSSGQVFLYTMDRNNFGDKFNKNPIKAPLLNVEVFSNSYPGVLSVNGKQYAAAEAVSKLVRHSVEYPFKMSVTGITGTGKTSFLKSVSAQITATYAAEGKDIRIILWDTNCRADNPVSLITSNTSDKMPSLLLVEDAHLLSDTAFASLLNLMDGMETPDGLHVIVSHNPKEVSPARAEQMKALVRAGRCDLEVNLDQLDKPVAEKLQAAIEKHHPELVKITAMVDKMTYPAALGDVWACFRTKTMADMF